MNAVESWHLSKCSLINACLQFQYVSYSNPPAMDNAGEDECGDVAYKERSIE